jgi:hypothetical protein
MSRTRFEARTKHIQIIKSPFAPTCSAKWKRTHHITETKERLHKKKGCRLLQMTPCSLVNMYRCFGGTSYLHHQGRWETLKRKQALLQYRYIPTRLHGVSSHKTTIFIVRAIRKSDLICKTFCHVNFAFRVKKTITDKVVGQRCNNQ